MRKFAIITAAGSGTRLGFGMPKALVPLGEKTILALALQNLPPVDGLVVSAPATYQEAFRSIVAHEMSAKSGEYEGFVEIVPGGCSRQSSVAAALDMLEKHAQPVAEDDLVVVHDAARCLTPTEVFDRVFNALEEGACAVIPAIPVADTIKLVRNSSQREKSAFKALNQGSRTAESVDAGSRSMNPALDPALNPLQHPVQSPAPSLAAKPEFVESTLDRAGLRAVQTPQGFFLKTLLELHERFKVRAADESRAFGDDAGMAEEMGIPVAIVSGDDLAFKITRPLDLNFAKCLQTSNKKPIG